MRWCCSIVLPLLLAGCWDAPQRPAAIAEIWLDESWPPEYEFKLNADFAEALDKRRGKQTSKDFPLFNDEYIDQVYGRVIFEIGSTRYSYLIMRCPVPDDGSEQYIWRSPQDDMRVQVNTQEELIDEISKALTPYAAKTPQ